VSLINLDNYEAVRCDNIHCTQPEHIKQINCLCKILNACLTQASTVCFNNTMQANSGTAQLQRKSVPGWTEYVEEAHIQLQKMPSTYGVAIIVLNLTLSLLFLGKQELCKNMLYVIARS